MKSCVKALKTYINEMPQRIIIVGVAFLTLLKKRMTNAGMTAQTNALITIPPPAISSNPKIIAIAAPKPAPEEMPIV